MTFNCRFETPCGWCEKFDKECREVRKIPKNDRFNPQVNNNPMGLININPLSTITIKGCKCK